MLPKRHRPSCAGKAKSQVKANTYCQTRLPWASRSKCNFTSSSSSFQLRVASATKNTKPESPEAVPTRRRAPQVIPLRSTYLLSELLLLCRVKWWTTLEINANEITKRRVSFDYANGIYLAPPNVSELKTFFPPNSFACSLNWNMKSLKASSIE